MYTFSKRTAGRFDIYASFQRQGDTHLKKFEPGVTPLNQQTVNVYAKGEFRFDIADFSQTMPQGSCSLDLAIDEFPAGVVSTETVLSPYALRYCVSPSAPSPFTRSKANISEGSPLALDQNSLVFVLSGAITVNGVSVGSGGYVLVGANSPVSGVATVLAVA
jgi:hypothetical protein